MANNKNNPAGDLNKLGDLGKLAGKPDSNRQDQNTTGVNLGASLGSRAAAAAGEAMSDQQTLYEVQKGDTLSGIGQRFGIPWKEIYEANRDQVKDPDMIHVGWKLRIPNKK
ncbi:MAG TPA: LysM domain-containing protein [Chitinophagaceae bacterium]